MLREISQLLDFRVDGLDGPVGRVSDIHVDDEYWIIRGVVVQLDPGLGGARVLPSPTVLNIPRWDEKLLLLKLTRAAAAGLPLAAEAGPVCCRNAQGCQVKSTTGTAGRFRDFLVSDVKWVVRYLLIETGPWLLRRKVMVVPEQVERFDRSAGIVELRIRADEVRQSQRYERQPINRPPLGFEQQSSARIAGSRSRR